MAAPIITLTTDFGLSDHYVGVMKGVILGICPGARIVDISHDIPTYDVFAGGFVIEAAWRYFPKTPCMWWWSIPEWVVPPPDPGRRRRALLCRAR